MKLKYLLCVIVLLFVGILPVMAQDATLEAVPTVEAPETPVETPSTNVLSVSNILSFLIGGIVSAAGVIAFIGTQARNAMQDPAKMVLAERLGDSVPQETANKLIDGLSDVLAFLREATDRQPALLKPSPNTTNSSGGYTTTTPPMP